MKKKIISAVVWLLLAVVGVWIIIMICLATYLYTALSSLPFIVGLSIFLVVFFSVFFLVVNAVHTLGNYILQVKPGGMEKCPAK